MRHSLATAVALGLTGLALAAVPAPAQVTQAPLVANVPVAAAKVVIDYGPQPSDPQLQPIYAAVRQQNVLEKLQRFLAPLRLARQLTVHMAQCGNNVVYRPYQPGGDVTICYEFIKQVADLAPAEGSQGIIGVSLVPREATIIGPVVEEVLHDVALAVFDNLQIPIWGRPEDAADNVAALVMLQFGTDVAQTTIMGTAYFLWWAAQNVQYTESSVADIRPPLRQRYYNILCVAYGANPVKFSVLQAFNRNQLDTDLPADRATGCKTRYAKAHAGQYEGDYEKLAAAFKTLILDPYVDPELLKQVLATNPLK